MAIRSLHMRKGSRDSERRRPVSAVTEAARSRKRGTDRYDDSEKPENSSMLMITQMGICIVVLLFCIMMRVSNSEPYLKAKEWYVKASTTPTNFQDPVQWVMGGGLERLRGNIMEVFAPKDSEQTSESQSSSEAEQPGEAQQVIAPKEDGSASSSQAKSEASKPVEASSSAQVGAKETEKLPKASGPSGGWWPWSPKAEAAPIDKQAVPAGCWAGPVFLTAPAAFPTYGAFTCGFGLREHPITGESDFHRGIDIAAPLGASVFAAWPGTVAEVGFSNIYGNYIKIDHSPKLSTMYSHCSEILAKPGINVRAKDRIALVGSTGISTGSHVHFDLIVGGLFVNPLYAFDFIDYGN